MGVQCQNGRIVGINISGFKRTRIDNRLAGIIPSSLDKLLWLLVLDLSQNSLTRSIPSFASLRNLTFLDMLLNFLSGTIPPAIGTLSKLKFLNFSNNSLYSSIPAQLGDLPNLVDLDLSFNSLSGSVPSDLRGLRNLQKMLIGHNFLAGALPNNLFPALTRLQFVVLNRNNFTGDLPDIFWSVSELHFLDASGSNFTECTSFYAERGLTFDNFGFPNATPPVPSGRATEALIILAGVLGGLGFIALLVIVLVILVVCIRKRGMTNQRGNGVGPVPTSGTPPTPGVSLDFSSLGEAFTYQLILQATGDFNDVSHVRLVPLLGHCLENENEKFLVYKYMPNGDLSSSLYRKTNSENDSLQSLDWITRLKIATGAAECLSYLHHECTPPLVHRDVQASSILLDEKFEVQLGSLSEVCAQEGDTPQNMITRFLRLPQTSEQGTSGSPTATCAYDVFCFGKVLLVLVTGKLGISASGDAAVKDWLEEILPYISIYDKELVTNIVDPSLIIDEDLLEVVREEHTTSERLRTTSSRGSWNTALFSSWRHSTSDVAAQTNKAEGVSGFKQSGTTGSQGSGQHGGGDHSSPTRWQSKEIFAEPSKGQDIERQDED
ncbi:hypothetical protein F0562_027910 [Nyssa sinensis]|uniref:Protein kinase domain-containing protein n=1 Tax=Nyssa sinensis TaxID=561372 RepID=A0A5J5B936_9ASTE|nr:hypothetical protein F0562_027910 [Nyssa sinensis]